MAGAFTTKRPFTLVNGNLKRYLIAVDPKKAYVFFRGCRPWWLMAKGNLEWISCRCLAAAELADAAEISGEGGILRRASKKSETFILAVSILMLFLRRPSDGTRLASALSQY
ncbi:hypothetical protein [Paraburkholderia sp. BL23I1N1]|uniref:hypothetical protein n=1 Tax=Paraburkholderia sp. BL23I1N1 TaxID=1938802 RepID=UPI000E77334F|nr:hypothetical protein [Paraburkholderia sp. BL23I1N1]